MYGKPTETSDKGNLDKLEFKEGLKKDKLIELRALHKTAIERGEVLRTGPNDLVAQVFKERNKGRMGYMPNRRQFSTHRTRNNSSMECVSSSCQGEKIIMQNKMNKMIEYMTAVRKAITKQCPNLQELWRPFEAHMIVQRKLVAEIGAAAPPESVLR